MQLNALAAMERRGIALLVFVQQYAAKKPGYNRAARQCGFRSAFGNGFLFAEAPFASLAHLKLRRLGKITIVRQTF